MALHDWADWASVATFFITLVGAGIGIFGYIRYRFELCRKTKRLEDYLRGEKVTNSDRGQRSALRIIKDVGLTEDEIIQASFRSKLIIRKVVPDEKGLAQQLLFEYEGRK